MNKPSGHIMILKYLAFSFHYVFLIYTIYPYSPYNTHIAVAVYISWLLNNNYCILSQIEYRLFGETYISKKLKPVSNKEKLLLAMSQLCRYIA